MKQELSLPEAYTAIGWALVWDAFGWVKAVHPKMGETRNSYPAPHRGLKYVLRAIDTIHKACGVTLEES